MFCGAEPKAQPNKRLAGDDWSCGRQLAETVLSILSPDPEDDIHLHGMASRKFRQNETLWETDCPLACGACNQIARICLVTDESDAAFALKSCVSAPRGWTLSFYTSPFWRKSVRVQSLGWRAWLHGVCGSGLLIGSPIFSYCLFKNIYLFWPITNIQLLSFLFYVLIFNFVF